jgi:uncharacterized protein (DUF697 family)
MAITRSVKKPRQRTVVEPVDAEAFIAAADPSPPTPPVAGPVNPVNPVNPVVPVVPAVPVSERPRTAKAMQSIRRHVPWAAGAGVLPLPGVDLAGIAAVQLHLMADLAELYGVPFRREAAKSLAATLMATLLERGIAGGLGSVAKLVPGVGTLLGLAVLPGLAAAGTYALGRVFLMHFESGGTFLDFDPAKAEAHFRAEFDKAPR